VYKQPGAVFIWSTFYVGFALSIPTYYYAILTAHSDGRFICLSYAYAILLSLLLIKAFETNQQHW